MGIIFMASGNRIMAVFSPSMSVDYTVPLRVKASATGYLPEHLKRQRILDGPRQNA